jgi:hypothetical protein
MKILGHNFLRSNFVAGDPVRKTAAARQQNRTANFIKGLQGLGCRVVKDVASNLENCLIVVDGTSDVEYPPNWTPPWSTGAKASIRLVSSSISGDGTVTFAEQTYQTNAAALESEDAGGGTYTTIQCKTGGIYHASLQCTLTVPIGVALASAGCAMIDSGDSIVLTNDMEQRYVEKMSGSSSERIQVSQSASMDFLATSGATYTVEATLTGSAYITNCIWCVHLIEEYTE